MANTNRFPKQPQGIYPTEQPIPTIMGAVNMQPTMGGIQQGMVPSAFHAPGSWVPPQSQMAGFISPNMIPSSAGTLPAIPSSMNAPGNKDRNYLQQQQKLRAMASTFKKSGPLSADSLIEDLLQQKETFSMCVPQFPAASQATVQMNSGLLCGPGTVATTMPTGPMPTGAAPAVQLPLWLSPEAYDLLPAVYRKVWEITKVKAADGRELVDTSRIFSILLTSGLPREALGYIWNLANSGIPGVLSHSELNITLALVALAQSGWRNFTSLSVLSMAQQPPVPVLQLDSSVSTPQSLSSPSTTQSIITQPLQTLETQQENVPQISIPQQDFTPGPPNQSTQIFNLIQGQELLTPVQDSNSCKTEPKQQAVPIHETSILDDNDDFTDFQSAPSAQTLQPETAKTSFFSPCDSPLGFNSFESPPVSPAVMKPKGSREVGSRLANYSFGASSSNSSQSSKQSLSESSEDFVFSISKSDDILFPKCAIKPPPQDTSQSTASTLLFIKENITHALSGNNKEDLKPTSIKSENEDKYSALRDISFDDLHIGSVDEEKSITNVMPSAIPIQPGGPIISVMSETSEIDEFGDFLSAGPSLEDDSFAEISKREKPLQTPSLIPTVEISSSEPQMWSANFGDFASTSNTQWREQSISTLPLAEATSCDGEEDEDFGDFVGHSTVSSLPQLNRLKEGINKTPDTQSVASLELGGFDSLSLGGAGQASSPEGGISDLRGALENVQWETATANPNSQEEGQEWRRCLQGCLALLQAAARILGAIEDPHVADEVVSSREGEDYLANLFEVYCVTQRISAASHQLLPASRLTLEPLLAEVEVAWQILTPFLERSSIEMQRDKKWNVSSDNTTPCCALCLVLVDETEGNMPVIRSGQHSYHASCANLWVNCVSAFLPAISVP